LVIEKYLTQILQLKWVILDQWDDNFLEAEDLNLEVED
jgi:hypothetical protein